MPVATQNEPDRRSRSRIIIVCVAGRSLAERPGRALHQEGLDEGIDVAVEDTIHIPHLLLRPMILDELVGMEDVTSNLMAEGDLFLDPADLRELLLLLFRLEIEETRLQRFHRRVTVAMLRPFVLAGHDNPRRNVRD